jgi:hypothetical protein
LPKGPTHYLPGQRAAPFSGPIDYLEALCPVKHLIAVQLAARSTLVMDFVVALALLAPNLFPRPSLCSVAEQALAAIAPRWPGGRRYRAGVVDERVK